MKVGIFQFNGCQKCFFESMLLKEYSHLDVQYISSPSEWNEKALDIAVISGFLTPEDQHIMEKITKNATNLISYGSCAVTGGIFGLAYQKGKEFL
ncbi:MAG: hypothetical protein DRO88_07725, partial [Promethearchaeia archaeon]